MAKKVIFKIVILFLENGYQSIVAMHTLCQTEVFFSMFIIIFKWKLKDLHFLPGANV